MNENDRSKWLSIHNNPDNPVAVLFKVVVGEGPHVILGTERFPTEDEARPFIRQLRERPDVVSISRYSPRGHASYSTYADGRNGNNERE